MNIKMSNLLSFVPDRYLDEWCVNREQRSGCRSVVACLAFSPALSTARQHSSLLGSWQLTLSLGCRVRPCLKNTKGWKVCGRKMLVAINEGTSLAVEGCYSVQCTDDIKVIGASSCSFPVRGGSHNRVFTWLLCCSVLTFSQLLIVTDLNRSLQDAKVIHL